jgi:hypothetical protein
MTNIQLKLSATQISKLRNGHTVQISIGQMGEGDSYFLNNDNLKKVHNAYNRNKAVRIKFDDNEMEGSGLSGIRKGLKKATHIANKINQTLHNENLDRKISTTSRKIKNTINKGEAIGNLGIPVVSDLYNSVQSTVNEGDRLLQRGLRVNSFKILTKPMISIKAVLVLTNEQINTCQLLKTVDPFES